MYINFLKFSHFSLNKKCDTIQLTKMKEVFKMKKIFILIGIFSMFLVNCFILSAAQTVNLNGSSWQLSRIRQTE